MGSDLERDKLLVLQDLLINMVHSCMRALHCLRRYGYVVNIVVLWMVFILQRMKRRPFEVAGGHDELSSGSRFTPKILPVAGHYRRLCLVCGC